MKTCYYYLYSTFCLIIYMYNKINLLIIFMYLLHDMALNDCVSNGIYLELFLLIVNLPNWEKYVHKPNLFFKNKL